MKVPYLILPLLFLAPIFAYAQPDLDSLQQQWVQALKSGESVGNYYWNDKSFTYAEIDSAEAENFIQLFKSQEFSELKGYMHESDYRHDDSRYISVGNLIITDNEFLILTGWRYIDGEWKKEIDIILTPEFSPQQVSEGLSKVLESERRKWVKLANQHNPAAHIKTSYTENAIYFGNGQKSAGRAEIADRYFYMENPNYQVDLEKERLWEISDQKILEVGRYFTGTERIGSGGLYVILWEKQKSKNWEIALDFNF